MVLAYFKSTFLLFKKNSLGTKISQIVSSFLGQTDRRKSWNLIWKYLVVSLFLLFRYTFFF